MSQLYRKTEKGKYVKYGPSDGFPEHWFPSEGLWMVTDRTGHHSSSWVGKLADIPAYPSEFAGCMRYVDELSDFILKYQNEFASQHDDFYPSVYATSKAILQFLAEKQGYVKGSVPATEAERNLTLGEL